MNGSRADRACHDQGTLAGHTRFRVKRYLNDILVTKSPAQLRNNGVLGGSLDQGQASVLLS
jgi:hypothetical protein